jgi:hypothetical protein
VTLARNEIHSIRFALEGHEEVTVQTDRQLTGGYVVLDILTGVVWLAVDAMTSAWYEPGPDPVRVLLSPKGQQCGTGICDYLQTAAKETR